jgi:hypothetical protein
MQHLIVHGDPGIRKDAVIEHGGEQKVCFSVKRQGDFHGPDEPQLWCLIGDADERDDFEKQNFVSHWLTVESVDAGGVTVIDGQGDLAI